jgi:hypothetical protein
MAPELRETTYQCAPTPACVPAWPDPYLRLWGESDCGRVCGRGIVSTRSSKIRSGRLRAFGYGRGSDSPRFGVVRQDSVVNSVVLRECGGRTDFSLTVVSSCGAARWINTEHTSQILLIAMIYQHHLIHWRILMMKFVAHCCGLRERCKNGKLEAAILGEMHHGSWWTEKVGCALTPQTIQTRGLLILRGKVSDFGLLQYL